MMKFGKSEMVVKNSQIFKDSKIFKNSGHAQFCLIFWYCFINFVRDCSFSKKIFFVYLSLYSYFSLKLCMTVEWFIRTAVLTKFKNTDNSKSGKRMVHDLIYLSWIFESRSFLESIDVTFCWSISNFYWRMFLITLSTKLT